MNFNTHIKNVRLYDEDGLYFLDITFTREDENQIYEVNYPKVRFPIEFVTEVAGYPIDFVAEKAGESWPPYLKLRDDGRLPLDLDGYGRYKVARVIKKKVERMTIKEIEKKLGHKIEIVSE